jgi:hypothetical protein
LRRRPAGLATEDRQHRLALPLVGPFIDEEAELQPCGFASPEVAPFEVAECH